MGSRSKNLFAGLAVALWPFVVLAPYTLGYVVPGNDFQVLYYGYKAYFIPLLAQGLFPLWAPSEAAGFPLYANPFAQCAYPLNALYLAYYLVTGTFTLWAYAMFTIMAFGLFGLGLYLWLRALERPLPVAVAATMVALSSLKLTELIRFPNAAHSAAWIAWLLYAATLAAKRESFGRGVVIFGAGCLLLFTAGYPYFIVYAPFLLVPYCLALISPVLRPALVRASSPVSTPPLRFTVGLSCAAGAAGLIASPWLLAVQQLMAQTVDRAVPNFEYATGHRFGWIGTLGSWIYPPVSMQEGWYYFGMMTTLVIAAFVISLITGGDKDRHDRVLAIGLGAWFVAISCFVLGRDSAIFSFIWHRTPILNQLRVWPRMNVLLVPAVCLMLATSVEAFTRRSACARLNRAALGIFVALVLAVLAAQLLLVAQQPAPRYWNLYWNEYFKLERNADYTNGLWRAMREFDERHFARMTLLSAGAFLAWLGVRRRHPSTRALPVACAGLVGLTLVDVGFITNAQWSHPFGTASPTVSTEAVRHYLDSPRVANAGTVDPVSGTQYAGALDNWGFIRHKNVYARYFDVNGRPRLTLAASEVVAARRFFGLEPKAHRLFVTRSIAYANASDFIADVDATSAASLPVLTVLAYDGNSLLVNVDVATEAWLSFVDNWDPYWTASVNGEPARIWKLFGSYKSVRLGPGRSIVSFEYAPPLWHAFSRLFPKNRHHGSDGP